MIWKMLVPILTIACLTTKWYRSSHKHQQRWFGFLVALLANLIWFAYFIETQQYWISLLSSANCLFAFRGMRNNKQKGI